MGPPCNAKVELNIQNNVKMLGYVPLDDLVGLYNIAALTAFPSYYECFPSIPIDASEAFLKGSTASFKA